MSRRRYTPPPESDALKALRRRAQENMQFLYEQRGKLKPDKEPKLTELERATADEIQRGFIVLEARRLRRELHPLLIREDLDPTELEYAEDLQDQLDDYDAELEPYSSNELKRFVRLWNKSRKAKYHLKESVR